MNREIKFRAWDNATKKMYYQSGITISNNHVIHMDGDVMQFIVLYDKRSREIYVGDIVANGLSGTWIVKPLENGSFSLLGIDGRYKNSNYSIDALNSNCEVIGNIYENPELLK